MFKNSITDTKHQAPLFSVLAGRRYRFERWRVVVYGTEDMERSCSGWLQSTSCTCLSCLLQLITHQFTSTLSRQQSVYLRQFMRPSEITEVLEWSRLGLWQLLFAAPITSGITSPGARWEKPVAEVSQDFPVCAGLYLSRIPRRLRSKL